MSRMQGRTARRGRATGLCALAAASALLAPHAGLAQVGGLETEIVRDDSGFGDPTLPDTVPGVPNDPMDPNAGSTFTISEAYGERDGPNLFHSFETLVVGGGDTALFTADVPDTTDTLIIRNTGDDPTTILGIFETEAATLGDADVFVLGRGGLFIGDNGQINVTGSFFGSSADTLFFDESGAGLVPFRTDVTDGSTLSWGTPAAFGFDAGDHGPVGLSRAGASGSIDLLQLPITLSPGKTFALVGKGVTAVGLQAIPNEVDIDGGTVALASVSGEAFVPLDVASWDATNGGPVTLSSDLDLVVSGGSAGGHGTVVIRGGQLVIEDGVRVTAFTTADDSPGSEVAVDALGIEGLEIRGSVLETRSRNVAGGERDGGIHLRAADIAIAEGSAVQTNARQPNATQSQAGDILLEAESIAVDASAVESFSGDVLSAGGAEVASPGTGAGATGDVTLLADAIEVRNGAGVLTRNRDVTGAGAIGDVVLAGAEPTEGVFDPAGQVEVSGALVASSSNGPADTGDIAIVSERLAIRDTAVVSTDNGSFLGSLDPPGGTGEVGDVRLVGRALPGGAGDGLVQIGSLDSGEADRSIVRSLPREGPGGIIDIDADTLAVLGGALVTASTFDIGGAGSLVVSADRVLLDGGPDAFDTGLFAVAASSSTAGAGSISIDVAEALEIHRGASVNVTVSGQFGGDSGDIGIRAGEVVITTEDAIVADSSATPEDINNPAGFTAGSISIQAKEGVVIRDGSIAASSSFQSGGDVTIEAGTSIELINETRPPGAPAIVATAGAVTTAVAPAAVLPAGTADPQPAPIRGGDVLLSAPTVIARSSGIVAASTGAGGDIIIEAENLLTSGGSLIEVDEGLFETASTDALVRFNVTGNEQPGRFEVRSPDSAVIADIAGLDEDFLHVAVLLADACAARDAPEGSLVVRGRDRAPAPPDERLRILELEEL